MMLITSTWRDPSPKTIGAPIAHDVYVRFSNFTEMRLADLSSDDSHAHLEMPELWPIHFPPQQRHAGLFETA